MKVLMVIATVAFALASVAARAQTQTDFSGKRLAAVSTATARYQVIMTVEKPLLPKLNIRHDRNNGTLSLRHRSGVQFEMGLRGLALSAEF